MMKNKLYIIALVVRSVITFSYLSVVVFLRTHLGENIYAPFTNKSSGEGDDKYRVELWVRVVMTIGLYFWIRVFLVIQTLMLPNVFDAEYWNDWGHLLNLFFTIKYWSHEMYHSTGMFFFILSFAAPIVATLQQVYTLNILKDEDRPMAPYLGHSLLFSWVVNKLSTFNHNITDYFVWGVVEPLLVGLVALVLYFCNLDIYAAFFGLSALGLMFQGQSRRIWLRRKKLDTEDDVVNRKKHIRVQTKIFTAVEGLEDPDDEDCAGFPEN